VFSLEAAASRFEDIADLPLVLDPSTATRRSNTSEAEYGAHSSSQPSPLPPAMQTITTSTAAPIVSAASETPKSVSAFQEDIVNAKLKPFIESTQSFAGPNVIEVVRL
jgi:adenylyl cyclase-associated protein